MYNLCVQTHVTYYSGLKHRSQCNSITFIRNLVTQSNNEEMKPGSISRYSHMRFFASLSINQAPEEKKLMLTE